MSKKFTGVHSGGQNIPVYDKDAHSAIEQKLDTSAFQSVSGNFLTAVPDAYATKDYADSAANAAASGKLDTDTFSQVSGDFLTAVPQSYLQNTDLTVTSGKVTEISGIPLSAGGTLPDTIPVSGVSGISVTETENEVLIGISADFATSSDLEKKLDTSAFSSVSGNFLTAVPENYSTKEYLSEQISGKYDTSSFAEVSGDFLTAVPESAISGFATHDEVESAISGLQPSGNYVTADELSSYTLEDSTLTVKSTSENSEYIISAKGSYSPTSMHLISGFKNIEYGNESTAQEVNLNGAGLSGFSLSNDNFFSFNSSGVSGRAFTENSSYSLTPAGVSGMQNHSAWSYGQSFTNKGFTVKEYGKGLFVAHSSNSGSENSVHITNNGLTASGGSGNSAKTIVSPYDVNVTSYNGQKTYSLTSIGESQPKTGNMSSYKYINFPYHSTTIFGHTANVQEARRNLTGFDVSATFDNAAEGIVTGNAYYCYINIPFTAESENYDIRWNFTGGNNSNGFTAAVLTATETGYNWTAKQVGSAYFSGKSGVFNVTGLTENTTYYLYAWGASPSYGSTNITPFTAEIGSAKWYDFTATSAGFIIPDASAVSGAMQTSGLEYDGDKISGYMGSAFKAGDELPQSLTDAANYVSATSGNIDATIENVSSNSGVWGGSALPISAGPGIKVNLVDNTLVFSNDETVLFETTDVYGAGVCNLSESLKNFERIGVKPTRGYNGTPNPGGAGPWNYFDTDQIVGGTTEPFQAVCPYIMEYINWKISQYNPNADCTVLTWNRGFQKNMQDNGFFSADSFTACVGIQKVIGINRK